MSGHIPKFPNDHPQKRTIFYNNIIAGIAFSIGAAVGLALLVTALTYVGSNIDLVPVVGNFISDVIDFILAENQHL